MKVDVSDTSIAHSAENRWNAEADEFNQWDALGQDEKDTLIEAELEMITRTNVPEVLPLDVRKASASFPDGWDSSYGRFSSQGEVSEFLKGRRISAVEFTDHCTIRFVLEGGISVSLTPSGTEGDDLELTVKQPA